MRQTSNFQISPLLYVKSAATISFILLLLTGCTKPVEHTEDIRPVRVMQLQKTGIILSDEFTGEVRPRYESRLGFRVGGKIIDRKVDVGAQVKRGQVLMQLDPTDLALAQAQAQAALNSATSNRDLAQAEKQRFEELYEKKFISKSALDAKQAAYRSAQAGVEQAQAALKGQANQSGYSALVADSDGVVTAIDAEAGQVVAPGTPVVRLARLDEKEVVIGIPENKLDSVRQANEVRVRLWALGEEIISGKIREIAPSADPVTRTFAMKISLPKDHAAVKFGMTAYVSFASNLPQAQIKVPLTALYQEKGQTSVWLAEQGVARLVPVKVAGAAGNDLLLSQGVQEGQLVVTAGVNSLKPGQKIKILGQAASGAGK